MDSANIVVEIIVIGILTVISVVAFRYLSVALSFLSIILKLIAAPVVKLWDWLSDLAERRASRFVPESLDRKFWVWGGLRPFALFAAALLTVLVVFLIGVFRGEGSEIGELILFNTTFGAFFALLVEGFSFSPATMIAIGFSSFLAGICIRRNSNHRWYIHILFIAAITAASAILANALSGVLGAAGMWFFTSLKTIFKADASGFLARASRFLGLVFFGYFAILIVLLTVREYCACLCFGPIALVVIVIASELAELILPEAIGGPVCNFVILVSFFGVIIGTEYYRERLENPEEEVAPAPAPGHSISYDMGTYDMGNFDDLP